ncbi:hypothetical protein FH621_01700 [Latilactobacillus curvatus]|uniref:hypothetical protein n=1 Tax=Latilactobacillus curvatus TaxID=28038 RepID=UPI00217EF20B|nr:hypothetical protein [Latilactobacillus curvatus]MCS6142276.1 hypothetical protein [Latilactobacillus curvatus]
MQIAAFVISLLAFIMSSILFGTKIYDRFMTPVIEILNIYPVHDIVYIKISVLNRSSSPIAVTHVSIQNYEANSFPHLIWKNSEHKAFGDSIPSNIPQKSIIQLIVSIPIDSHELSTLTKENEFSLSVTTSLGNQQVTVETKHKLRSIDQLAKERNL